jgi:hypothetical protein
MPSTKTDRLGGLTTSVAVKAPVLAASTGANLTLSSTQVVDGIVLSDGDRVLVKDQDTTSENGIYKVDTGTWSRATDFDGSRDVVRGTVVYVASGSANGDLWFGVSSTGDNIPGTNNITFAQQAGLTATTALTGVLDTSDNAINLSEGTAVASDTTSDIWATDGNTVHLTGTATVTSLSTAPRVGAIRNVIADGAFTLTHSSDLKLPGSSNITAAVDDRFTVYADSTVSHILLNYQKVTGRAVDRTNPTEGLETVSTDGTVMSGVGISVISSDSTSGITLNLGTPAVGVGKEVHFQTSATALALNTTATTIFFQNSSGAIAASGGSTVLNVSSSAVVIAGAMNLRGLSATVWRVTNASPFLTVSS